MPSSIYQHISDMVTEIVRTQNLRTVLDIGAGFGKWGILTREFKELHYNRVFKNQWCIRVDAIEIFKPYIEEFPLDYYYDNVLCGDVCDLIDLMPDYDLIIAGDVIEHIEKARALPLLKTLIRKARKKFLLSISLEDWLNNVIVANNPHEAHKSTWKAPELLALTENPIKTYAYKGTRGDLGVFVYEK